jgi:HAD superfamily hydrolase (TIGR01549 family)
VRRDEPHASATRPPIAIGFDFDHTLGVDNGLERKAMYAYAEELGRPLDPAAARWRARIDDLLASFRAGESSMDEMIARFAAALDVHSARAERWREICLGLVESLVRAIDGAPELLGALRERGIPTAVLTNGWTPLQQKKIARAFGDAAAARIPVLVSDAIGVVKPAPAAFDALAELLRAPREHVWYVGDNAVGDVGGALAAGLRAVWFNWENQTYPQDLPPPTLTVASLRELEAWVKNTIAP